MKSAAIIVVLAAVLAPAAGAQRGSRPADDWIATLEAPERVAGLKISEVVAAMKLRPGNVVADLGAGSGLFVVPIAAGAGATGKVLAVEIDRNFFPHIANKATAAGVTNVRTVYIKSLAKYLKPGARIVIVDYLVKQGPHRDDPSLQVGKDEAAKLLAAIGFKPAEDVALFPDKSFVIYGR